MLHWGTEYLEKLLPQELQFRMKEIRVDPSFEMEAPVPMLKGDTGEVLKMIETPVINRVSRRKIRKLLSTDGSLDIRVGPVVCQFLAAYRVDIFAVREALAVGFCARRRRYSSI